MPMRCRCPPENSCGKRFRVIGAKPDCFQQPHHALFPLVTVQGELDAHGLTDDVSDIHARVEGRIWILKNDLHLAPKRLNLRGRQGRNIYDAFAALDSQDPTAKKNLAGAGLYQPHDRASGRTFSATALAHQTDRLTLFNGEIDPIHGLDRTGLPPEHAAFDGEVLPQPPDLEKDLVRQHGPAPR